MAGAFRGRDEAWWGEDDGSALCGTTSPPSSNACLPTGGGGGIRCEGDDAPWPSRNAGGREVGAAALVLLETAGAGALWTSSA